MKQTLLFLYFLVLGFQSLSQDYISDSLMGVLVDSGIADEKFRPNGKSKDNERVGKWEDYTFEFLNTYRHNEDETVDVFLEHILTQSTGKYENGKKEGLWKFYAIEGKTYKRFHIADINFRNGKKDGPVTFYFSDENIAAECTYQNDYLKGKHTVYYETGEVNRIGNISKRNLNGKLTYFYKSGAKKIVSTIIDGMQEGEYKSYYQNGDLKSHRIYVNDSIHGKSVTYYPNGKLQQEGEYKMGEPISWKYYYDSGQLWVHRVFENGKLHNILELYDSEGKPLDFGTLKDGTGTVKYYTEEAKIYSINTYENGVIVDKQDF